MNEILEFANRNDFRTWLGDHCLSSSGVWLLFGKAGGPKTIKAKEALEEVLFLPSEYSKTAKTARNTIINALRAVFFFQ